jgi:hypothetical protein
MSASLSSRSAVLVALSLAFFSAPAAQASPWTQPQGKLAVKIGDRKSVV